MKQTFHIIFIANLLFCLFVKSNCMVKRDASDENDSSGYEDLDSLIEHKRTLDKFRYMGGLGKRFKESVPASQMDAENEAYIKEFLRLLERIKQERADISNMKTYASKSLGHSQQFKEYHNNNNNKKAMDQFRYMGHLGKRR